MPKLIDLTGKKFHRWTVVSKAESRFGSAHWNCVCDCGNTASVKGADLRNGNSKSCGCYQKEVIAGNYTHGHNRVNQRTPTYQTWRDMKRRCEDKKHRNYKIYGAKGISVCSRWKKFENFLADMGERPDGKTLDRINSNKGYSKLNCRWSTPKEQANNMSRNRYLEYRGKRQTVSQWADELGINYCTLNSRLFRGWSVKKSLTTP